MIPGIPVTLPDLARAPASSWLPPSGRLRVELRSYPLSGSEPLVTVGQTVFRGEPLSDGRGLLETVVPAPCTGVVRGIHGGEEQVVVELEPTAEVAAPPRHTRASLPAVTLQDILELLARFPLRNGEESLAAGLQALRAGQADLLLVNGLDPAGLLSRALLLRDEGGALGMVLELLHRQLPGRKVVPVLPRQYQKVLKHQSRLPLEGVRWLENRYPRQHRELLGSMREVTRGAKAVVVGVETLVQLYYQVLEDGVFPYYWVDVKRRNGRVQVFTVLRGTPAAEVALAGGLEAPWEVGDGWRHTRRGFPRYGALVPLEENYPSPDPCILCGFCRDVCPRGLLPFYLYGLLQQGETEAARRQGLRECRLCGSCAVVCPSRLDLLGVLEKGMIHELS